MCFMIFLVSFVWIFDKFFAGFRLKQVYQKRQRFIKKIDFFFFFFFVVFIYVLHDFIFYFGRL
jgi:hypothetical protein